MGETDGVGVEGRVDNTDGSRGRGEMGVGKDGDKMFIERVQVVTGVSTYLMIE